MLSLKGDLYKETKGTPKSFKRSLDENTAILKNCEFEEYWELSIFQVTKPGFLLEAGSRVPAPVYFEQSTRLLIVRN